MIKDKEVKKALGAYKYAKKGTKFSRKRYRKFLREVGTLTRMTRAVAKGKYRLATPELAAVVGALVYVVNPADAIPDVIFPVGFVDDAGVVAAVVAMLGYEFIAFRAWEKEQAEARTR